MTDFPLKSSSPTAADKALHDDIMALIKRHLNPDTPERVLAVASQVVGQAIAMQDQRRMTSEMIWQIVGSNIEAGNAGVIGTLMNSKGKA